MMPTRIAKYLSGEYRAIVQVIPFGGDGGVIHAFSHSDWAGCLKTRTSTGGGVLLIDQALAHDAKHHCAIVSRSGGVRSHSRDLRGQGSDVTLLIDIVI